MQTIRDQAKYAKQCPTEVQQQQDQACAAAAEPGPSKIPKESQEHQGKLSGSGSDITSDIQPQGSDSCLTGSYML